MDDRKFEFTRIIVNEYISFLKKTTEAVNEAKRATSILLKKVLNLQDGEVVLIEEDGSIEIESNNNQSNRSYDMTENDKENKEIKLTLNGREVSEEELLQQKEAIKNQKGAKLEEVTQGNFRLHLND